MSRAGALTKAVALLGLFYLAKTFLTKTSNACVLASEGCVVSGVMTRDHHGVTLPGSESPCVELL